MNTYKSNRRTRRARRNLALKIVLEKEFTPSLQRYFDDVRRAAIRNFRDNAGPPNLTILGDKTEKLLKRHYRRVVKTFRNEMRLYISDGNFNSDDLSEKEEAAINQIMAIFIANQSQVRAGQINRTNIKDINDSFAEAQEELIRDERSVTPAAVLIIANRKMKDKFKGREGTIALTETQYVAEKTKRVESAVVSRDGDIDVISIVGGTIQSSPKSKKEWASRLDERTRDAHAQAEGQTVPANDPFIVNGERLMEPGDTSLGASPSNIINCHCSALYYV